jgi:hypothetical protein
MTTQQIEAVEALFKRNEERKRNAARPAAQVIVPTGRSPRFEWDLQEALREELKRVLF